MHRSLRALAVPAVALTLVAAACSDDDDAATTTTAAEAPASSTTEATATTMDPNYGATSTTEGEAPSVVGILEVEDQAGDGSSLTIKSVSIQGASGHIAIHLDSDGSPGAVVGHGPVPEGVSTDLVIPFDAPVESGTYWPMLHEDDGNETYDFPGADGPVIVDGNPVMTPIELTVE